MDVVGEIGFMEFHTAVRLGDFSASNSKIGDEGLTVDSIELLILL